MGSASPPMPVLMITVEPKRLTNSARKPYTDGFLAQVRKNEDTHSAEGSTPGQAVAVLAEYLIEMEASDDL